jgi:lipopolysaccharide biosynthesis glycosyltransferase
VYSIGLCVDERYFFPALTLLMSAAGASNPRDRRSVSVRVLTNRLSRLHAAVLDDFCSQLGFASFDLMWRQPSCILPLVDNTYITQATYLRFEFTPHFVRDPYLVYLDADMLVLGDIGAPLNDIGNEMIGAVRDQFNQTIGDCPALPGFVADFPGQRGKPYFNAGALWMEAELMPKIKSGTYRVAVSAPKYIKHNDQDALNLWLLAGTPVTSIPTAYNRFELTRFLEVSDWVCRVVGELRPRDGATVLHFVGPLKPWQSKCPRTAAVRDYRAFQRETYALLRRMGLSP